MPKQSQSNQLDILRHSCAHILAAAVQKIYPRVKFGIGPAIENGFYYDFEFPKAISDTDLEKISAIMFRNIRAKIPFEKKEVSPATARKLFKGQPYKLELITDLEKEGSEQVVVYKSGNFTDLCRGPHVKDSSQVGVFKLTTLAGAYWKGSEKNPMLTRIYGTAFETQKELDEYLKLQEEAKKRDHRKIGKELDLFSFHPEAPGDVFWHPKGWTIFKELMDYWREIHRREGYLEVRTPEILTRKIWDQSGHTTFFVEKMYRVTTPDADEWDMAVKPMNCDGGMLIYKSRLRSYKEFPLYMGELGVVHRYESSGETLGLLRVREITQDDAHLYCTPDQVKAELKRVIDLCFEIYESYGLELDRLELSTRPEGSIGSDEVWERAEGIMREVLKEKGISHQINEGDGAFYGPKFDFHLKDSLDRTWQCGTIQLDFAQPENFDLTYITEKGTRERPVMIHRTIYGSIERFMGILIEHYGGAFPVWLAPIQVVVIPVSAKQNDYAQKVWQTLFDKEFRVEVDNRDETMAAKIRDAQLQKVPYMLVVGEKEAQATKPTVSLRLRSEKNLGALTLEKFIEQTRKLIDQRSLKLWP
ncbi:threonine--tRNA ligase [Candidatus Parcubacteria bacterium]|nr:threonine--tRNA ligase [Candidatus Parcubacteria bacterium]